MKYWLINKSRIQPRYNHCPSLMVASHRNGTYNIDWASRKKNMRKMSSLLERNEIAWEPSVRVAFLLCQAPPRNPNFLYFLLPITSDGLLSPGTLNKLKWGEVEVKTILADLYTGSSLIYRPSGPAKLQMWRLGGELSFLKPPPFSSYMGRNNKCQSPCFSSLPNKSRF